MKTNNSNDFELKNFIKNLSDNLDKPHKFANIFCEAAKTQKSIDAVLKNIIIDCLQHDVETIEILKTYQKEVGHNEYKIVMGKIGSTIINLMNLVGGIILGCFIRKYF